MNEKDLGSAVEDTPTIEGARVISLQGEVSQEEVLPLLDSHENGSFPIIYEEPHLRPAADPVDNATQDLLRALNDARIAITGESDEEDEEVGVVADNPYRQLKEDVSRIEGDRVI
ncbi:hypothetical protein HON22_00135 [Candidatus Peregrinibacteria bacterium]|jgi:hypothetical protein|nr:hypothetical protein [Candidatus Peregrinibacteria bacterium]